MKPQLQYSQLTKRVYLVDKSTKPSQKFDVTENFNNIVQIMKQQWTKQHQ